MQQRIIQAFKEHGSKRFSLQEENKENGKSERIEKYFESDEAIKVNIILFVENIIMNLIIDNDFKEKNKKSYLFIPEFVYAEVSIDNNKTFKV